MKIRAFLNSKRFIEVEMIMKKNKRNRNGFTMTEFVVTVAIMGTLLSLVAPSLQMYPKKLRGTKYCKYAYYS